MLLFPWTSTPIPEMVAEKVAESLETEVASQQFPGQPRQQSGYLNSQFFTAEVAGCPASYVPLSHCKTRQSVDIMEEVLYLTSTNLGGGTMKLEERMLRSIRQRNSNVVFRSEFSRMGSSSQVTEVLKSLQAKGILVRIGTGVYAKTRKSSITGAIIPAGSLETLATEALKKMGVQVRAGSAAAEYNSGRTTQLPGAFVANTGDRRITRKIAVGGRAVVYENNYNRAIPST